VKAVTYINNMHELSLAKESGLWEVILSHRDFSRLGKLYTGELNKLLVEAKKLDLKTVFEWDILMTNDVLYSDIELLGEIDLNNVDCMRVQDSGALNYCLDNLSHQIQVVLESGNHNLCALKSWKSLLGDRLDRLVVSIEIPKDKLKEYISVLSCNVEILGLGQILLFYSPRSLLSPMTKSNAEFIYAQGESEESPHKGFPIVENKHGTFMFHIKNIFLLENIDELLDMNLSHLRLNLQGAEDFSLLPGIVNLITSFSKEKSKQIKGLYKSDVIRGYFSVNKSDVLFNKLKNHRLQRKDEKYLGPVMEVSKKKYIAIKLVRADVSLRVGDEIKFILPEGGEKITTIKWIKNSSLESVESISDAIAIIDHVGAVVPKSVVYLS
jgi:putative protease